jgi:hypothetical protein
MRAFTLVTAVCGSVSYKVPPNILPHGSKLAPAFYRSSWEMLKLYEEYDIEFPQSTSVTIRLIHSSCLHHIGKTKASWHVLNQALLLAKDLVPCEQHLLAVRDPIEALLLRHNFWISLTSARSGMLLGDYPIGQHMTLMESGLEPSFTGGEEASLLDVTKFHNRPPFEKCLREGVNICRRLWAAATKVIFNISTSASRQNITLAARPKSLVELMETYLVFASVLDGLPSWLHRPDAPEADGADVSLYQSRCFWAQRTDLLISFHCLKLIILRHCVKHDLRVVLGLSNDPLALALRRLEIAQEFLGVIEGVPFTSLQLIGESCVSDTADRSLSKNSR